MTRDAADAVIETVQRGYDYDERLISRSWAPPAPSDGRRWHVAQELGLSVAALTANRQVDLLEQQARQFHAAACRAV